MKKIWHRNWYAFVVGLAAVVNACGGCRETPSAHTVSRNYSLGDAPVDPPVDQCDGLALCGMADTNFCWKN